MPGAHGVRFVTGFCLIANGVYIGVGSFEGVGDAGDLLRHGSRVWQLWAFGVVTVPLGLFLWHGQGPYLGLAMAEGQVSHRAAFVTLVLLILVVVLELFFGGE
jgi:hypothetical protein